MTMCQFSAKYVALTLKLNVRMQTIVNNLVLTNKITLIPKMVHVIFLPIEIRLKIGLVLFLGNIDFANRNKLCLLL